MVKPSAFQSHKLGFPPDGKGFPCSSVGKQSACNAEHWGLISLSGRSRGGGNGNELQYSCLENPTDRDAWQDTVHEVARVGHDWATKPPPPEGKVLDYGWGLQWDCVTIFRTSYDVGIFSVAWYGGVAQLVSGFLSERIGHCGNQIFGASVDEGKLGSLLYHPSW